MALVVGNDDGNGLNISNIPLADSSNDIFTGNGVDIINTAVTPDPTIFARGGNDIITLEGDSLVFGGAGDDQFFVENGINNLLVGGAGADTFNVVNGTVPAANSNESTIFLFELAAGGDSINLNIQGIAADNVQLTFVNGSDTQISLVNSATTGLTLLGGPVLVSTVVGVDLTGITPVLNGDTVTIAV